jgi:hypothetical protein
MWFIRTKEEISKSMVQGSFSEAGSPKLTADYHLVTTMSKRFGARQD